jgi:hypothetical protein
MKMTKMALLAGAALAVTTAGAQADDLEALKAQIETLNARVAAMETAPSVPAGYQLIAVSEGEFQQTPGLGMTARELAAYGNKSTIISVLPTADAPAGATISWSGYARAGLVYSESSRDVTVRTFSDGAPGAVQIGVDNVLDADGDIIGTTAALLGGIDPIVLKDDAEDIDVRSRGQIRVKAATDTAVGEVGVDIRLRGNFNGNGNADVYADVAWGYWAMTPELTFGGGYTGSLGNIGYGYDGACSCYYTDNADVAFNPGDVTQMRLSYASGPLSFAVALEDGSRNSDAVNGDKLGAAGEIKYSGDMISGEISGVWRDVDAASINDADELWQVGAGLGISLGDMASLSLAAAMGKGPATIESEGVLFSGLGYDQSWWGVSALASVNLTDDVHAELAAGYKVREGDEMDIVTFGTAPGEIEWSTDGVDYKTFGLMAGIYYQPVDQLTIGVEAEVYATDADFTFDADDSDDVITVERETENASVNLVTVWRF